jgi:hypothetical protein
MINTSFGETGYNLALPVNVSLFENVLHIVFIEIVPFHRYGTVGLGIVVDVVVSTMPLEDVAGRFQFLCSDLSGIHCFPPVVILLYTTLCIKSIIHKERMQRAISQKIQFDQVTTKNHNKIKTILLRA